MNSRAKLELEEMVESVGEIPGEGEYRGKAEAMGAWMRGLAVDLRMSTERQGQPNRGVVGYPWTSQPSELSLSQELPPRVSFAASSHGQAVLAPGIPPPLRHD